MSKPRLRIFGKAGASALLASLALLLSGCKDDGGKVDNGAPYIDLSVESLEFSDEGGNKSFNIDSNCDWAITADQAWCRVSNANKTGNGKKNNIAVTCSQNDSDDSREAILTVKCPSNPSISKDIAVVQLGRATSVTVSKTDIEVEAAPSTVEITVTANADWKIVKPQTDTWYSIEPQDGTAGDVSTKVSVAFEQNETAEARKSSFDVEYVDNQTKETKKVTVNVSQKAIVASVALSKDKIELLYADAAEEEITLTVQGAWKAVVAKSDEWVSVDPAEGVSGEFTVKVAMEANTAEASRTASIKFVSMDKAEATLTVTQSGLAPKVIFEEETISIAPSNVSEEVTFSANYAWTASTDDEWLSVEPASGEAGEACVITVTAVKNAGAERVGKVKIECGKEGSKITATLNVIQDAYDGEDLSEKGTSNCYIVNKPGATFKFNATVMGNGKADLERNIIVEKLSPADCDELWRDNTRAIVTDIKYKNGYVSFKTPNPLVPGNVVIAAYDAYGTIIWSWHLWVDNYDENEVTYPITYTDDYVPPQPTTFMSRNIGALSDGTAGTREDVIKSYGMMYQWGRKDPFLSANATFVPNGTHAESKAMYDTNGDQIVTSGPWCDEGANTVRMDLGLIEEFQFDKDVQNSIRYSIENPTTYMLSWAEAPEDMVATAEGKDMYQNAFRSRWCYVPVEDVKNEIFANYLWGNAYGYDSDEYGTKTIYDPCPLGWRVPDRNAWRFAAKGGSIVGYGQDGRLNAAEIYHYDANNADNCKYLDYKWGFHLCTGGEGGEPLMFIPAAGARSYSQAEFSNWANIGVLATYWTNSPYGGSHLAYKHCYAARMEISAGRGNEDPDEHPTYDKVSSYMCTSSSMWTSAGMPVRCVKEVEE